MLKQFLQDLLSKDLSDYSFHFRSNLNYDGKGNYDIEYQMLEDLNKSIDTAIEIYNITLITDLGQQ